MPGGEEAPDDDPTAVSVDEFPPNLVGLTGKEALDLLDEHEISGRGELRIGHVEFDEDADAASGTVVATEADPEGIRLIDAHGGPSQSPEDAARDQIVPEFAAVADRGQGPPGGRLVRPHTCGDRRGRLDDLPHGR